MGTGGLFLRKVRSKVSEEPTGFVWVEGRVAGSGYPASRGQLEWLRRQGIGFVLTLTEDPLPEEMRDGLSMTFRHVPMGDHDSPSLSDLDRAAAVIAEGVEGGTMGVVHGLAGEGRTGCALAAYFIKKGGFTAEEALATIRKAKPDFVEWSQEKAVYDYAKSLGRK